MIMSTHLNNILDKFNGKVVMDITYSPVTNPETPEGAYIIRFTDGSEISFTAHGDDMTYVDAYGTLTDV